MTPPLNTVHVTDRSPATLLYGNQGSGAIPIEIDNLSASVPMWIGNTQAVTPGSQSAYLAPGASRTFDGSVSIYAITATGTAANAAVVPGGLGFSSGISLIQSASLVSQGPGSYTLFTFPATGRIWTTQLSLSITSTSSYALTGSHVTAVIQDPFLNITLASAEAAVAGPAQKDTSNVTSSLAQGLPVQQDFTAKLIVPIAPPNTSISASGILLYSIP